MLKNDELIADNPLHSGKARKDILGLKDTLERRYFGKNFDDNIHIQIIYNILDIEKILVVYSANITAALDHLVDETTDVERVDFIGYMSTKNTYGEFMHPSACLREDILRNIEKSRNSFEALLKTKRLGYFGFEYDPNSKNNKQNNDIKKRLYHLMALAGQLRQWCFHSDKDATWLYNLETKLKKEYCDTLDHFFNSRFDEINGKFIKQNTTNLAILKEVFPHDNFSEVAELYYDFIVLKSHKNMGFSIKKLRENMLNIEGTECITNQRMDSVRDKLYKLIDFSIFYYYQKNPNRIERNVNILRAAVTEDEKELFYVDESALLWKEYSKLFRNFCNKINDWVRQKVSANDFRQYIDLGAYREKSNFSYFSKLMYAMSFFLDGKEINDLLTTLINKFDNIAAFIETAKELRLDVSFKREYAFFNNYQDYVHELNIVKNIARMKKPAATAKKTQYRDALMILGIPNNMSEEELNAELDKILAKDKIDPKTNKKIKAPHDFRNFIVNNVMDSNRFVYLVKFCNPANVRQLVDNTNITEFVMKRMPEAQIDRYYSSCIARAVPNATIDDKIRALAKMMKAMNFNDFRDVKQKSRDPKVNMQKERYKAIIRLYLAVVYQLVKNLINVNARYIMAFHCLERDARLYGVDNISDDYLALTKKLCDEGDNSRSGYLARNKRMRSHIERDVTNAERLGGAVKLYRNNVAHLTAVRNCAEFIVDITKIDSYFALYHYLIQRQLAKSKEDAYSSGSRVHSYYVKLFKYKTYVKDFVKALNATFAYNLPRFKNLSIQELFDRNEIVVEKSEA